MGLFLKNPITLKEALAARGLKLEQLKNDASAAEGDMVDGDGGGWLVDRGGRFYVLSGGYALFSWSRVGNSNGQPFRLNSAIAVVVDGSTLRLVVQC